MDMILSECLNAVNEMTRHGGFAPVQWVLSPLPRNPATMGDEDECLDVGAFASICRWTSNLRGTVEEWNSVEVPSCRGSSQWINGCVNNRSGFGEEDDSNTGEVGERELVLVFRVL